MSELVNHLAAWRGHSSCFCSRSSCCYRSFLCGCSLSFKLLQQTPTLITQCSEWHLRMLASSVCKRKQNASIEVQHAHALALLVAMSLLAVRLASHATRPILIRTCLFDICGLCGRCTNAHKLQKSGQALLHFVGKLWSLQVSPASCSLTLAPV